MNLPDLVYEQLRHLLDMGERNQWAVGDFIRDVWEEIEKNVPKEEHKKEHATMIIQMATNTGADKSTLRSREKMSTFYQMGWRATWQPPYTYHHLRALMGAGPDGWADVASWGLTGGYNGGLATVEEIRDHIRGAVDPTELTRKRLVSLQRMASKIIQAEETPIKVSVQLGLVPAMIEDALDIL